MARITVEDCIDKFPSRFELVLVASNRARKLYSGENPTVEIDNGGSSGNGGALFAVGDVVHFFEADGSEYKVTGISGDTITIERFGTANTAGGLRTALADATNVRRRWEYYDQFDGAPGTSAYNHH